MFRIENEHDRDFAINLSQQFQRKLQEIALYNGWIIDGTADLARVFRVPGTFNMKEIPKEVKIEFLQDRGLPSVDGRTEAQRTPEATIETNIPSDNG
jgi:hypothetical protein